jgi:hypothetical protein
LLWLLLVVLHGVVCSMARCLGLPDPLTQKFWSCASTEQVIANIDRWGLATGILINATILKFFCVDYSHQNQTKPLVVLLPTSLVLALQCYQMVAVSHTRMRKTYLKNRMRWTLLQRIIRLCFYGLVAWSPAFDQTYRYMVHDERLGSHGSWRSLLSSALLVPVMSMLNTINHPLPFYWQTAAVCIKLSMDLVYIVPRTAVRLRLQGHGDRAHSACVVLDNTVGLLANVLPPEPHTNHSAACGQRSLEFILSFTCVVISVLLPLHLTFWYERRCKSAFLRSQRSRHSSVVVEQQAGTLGGQAQVQHSPQQAQVQHSPQQAEGQHSAQQAEGQHSAQQAEGQHSPQQAEGQQHDEGQGAMRANQLLPEVSRVGVLFHVLLSLVAAWWLCIAYAAVLFRFTAVPGPEGSH